MPAIRLLRREGWTMLPGERAAVEGVLSFVEPETSVEIGTHKGGSLEPRIGEPIERSQLVELQKDVADPKNVIALMQASPSWRLTRPLGAVSAATRRIRRSA